MRKKVYFSVIGAALLFLIGWGAYELAILDTQPIAPSPNYVADSIGRVDNQPETIQEEYPQIDSMQREREMETARQALRQRFGAPMEDVQFLQALFQIRPSAMRQVQLPIIHLPFYRWMQRYSYGFNLELVKDSIVCNEFGVVALLVMDTVSNDSTDTWIEVNGQKYFVFGKMGKGEVTVYRPYINIEYADVFISSNNTYLVIRLLSQYGMMNAQMQCAHNELIIFDITDSRNPKLILSDDIWYSPHCELINDFNGDGNLDILMINSVRRTDWYVPITIQNEIKRIQNPHQKPDLLGKNYLVCILHTLDGNEFVPVRRPNGTLVYWAGYCDEGSMYGPHYYVHPVEPY